ncbi:MAG TPA: TonB-dependent receptor [Gammaproteobacteria bacterium]|nr:TonB-dependent receptor [Gammaproteobacteria bacterium]
MKRRATNLALSRIAAAVVTAMAGALPVLAQQAQDQAETQAQDATEEIVVTGRLRSTALDVVRERLEQEVVSDFLSTEQIARTGDSTVSLALRRMPGLTLINDQFIYVRGLGERYSSTLLNNAYVPSPDLTRNVLPLDIFPAEILEALAVQKAYSPDMPAAFGGGNVNIMTRGIPTGPVVSIELGSGANSESDGDGISYVGGSDDSLGTDDGTRAMPVAIRDAIQEYRGNLSTAGIFAGLNRDGQPHLLSQAEAINRQLATSLYRDIDFEQKSLSPDASLEAALGNRWYFGGSDQWQFGALGLLSYDNDWRNRERTVRNVVNPDEEFFNEQRTTNQIAATGIVNLGLNFTTDHRVTTSSMFLRNTEDEGIEAAGHTFNFVRQSGRGFRDYRIRFEERELRSNQIRGQHVVGQDTVEILPFLDRPWLEGLTYDWYYSDSTAETTIPSEILISAEDTVDPATGAVLSTALRRSGSAANYRYTDLDDEVESYGWDLLKPFANGNVDVSGGWDYSRKARGYLQTELTLGTTAAAAGPILVGSPGSVLSEANLLNPVNQFRLGIGGIGTESYLAAQTVEGAYLKADAMIGDSWRLSGGVRWEQFEQVSLPIDPLEFDVDVGQSVIRVTGSDPQQNADNLLTAVFLEDDTYPALSATYMRPNFWAETFQLRFGVSKTVARPDLREISDASYIDPLTEARVRGRPGLRTSPINNLDVRGEWFFDNGDNFTLSLFYKDIDDPIETAEGAGSDNNVFVTFVNAESAEIKGLEVEWLKNLESLSDRWGRWVEPFFLAGNLTLSESELTVGNVGLDLTNPVRPMTGHSDHVANVQVGFDSPNGGHSWSLVYNTFSERIFFAGRGGAQDTYEQPFDSVDLIYSFHPTERLSLKFRMQNVLNEKLELEQAGVTILEQSLGTTANIDIKWDLGR